MRDRIAGKVKTSNQSEIKLIGNYVILPTGIELFFRAIDAAGSTMQSASFRLLMEAYTDLEYEPKTSNLESLIKLGVVVSKDFRVELNASVGKRNLLLKNGSSVTLMVKANRTGYVFIVGHTFSGDSKFSYLVPFGDDDSKRDHVLFINADDANRWIEIGKFEIAEPFGTEVIQAFASTTDIVDALPEFYINDDGYAVIGRDPEVALVQTRGILRKKKKEVAEASLTFTTAQWSSLRHPEKHMPSKVPNEQMVSLCILSSKDSNLEMPI